jgi:hypothetical protein
MPTLTRDTAITADHFHHSEDCAQSVTYGPRGGPRFPRTEEWRRNGATQTWKREPDRYRVPVKYGLRSYGSLTEHDGAPYGPWHVGTATECDLGALRASYTAWEQSTIAARVAARAE